ncbi:MAG: heavy-metal-associated domain-containing protein [Rhizobiaceae bacterium]|nr:heavy-metal-associated domain-containing protein [Rhizobiaceae bacterium]
MLKLNVPDMTCGHCAAAVTKAVKDVDASAVVQVDLATKTVAVSTAADPSKVSAALADAGYPARAA